MFSSSSSSSTARAPLPAHPDLPRRLFWFVLLLLLGLLIGSAWLRPQLLPWAQDTLAAPLDPAAPAALASRAGADLLLRFAAPSVQLALRRAAAAGLAVVGLDLLFALAALLHAAARPSLPPVTYQLRTLHPRRRLAGAAADPAALWARLLAGITHAPGATSLTLSRAPNQPAALGLRLAAAPDALPARLHPLRAALRAADPTAQLDPVADPLAQPPPGTIVVIQSLHLAAPAHLPLAPEPLGLLPAIASALRCPQGVVHAEIQLALAAEPPRALAHRQALARRALALLRRHSATPGGAAASQGIAARAASPAAHVAVRVVLLLENRAALPTAHTILASVASALAPLRAVAPTPPLGARTQRLRPGRRTVRPAAPRAPQARAGGHPPWPLVPPRLLPALWAPPAALTPAELSALWAVPASADAELAWLPNRILPAPASAFVPPGATDWLTLGHAHDDRGQPAPVGLPLRALHEILHVTAGMGAGKSQALAGFCQQLIPHGFILLDGKGDDAGGLATAVRQLIPRDDEHRLILVDLLDTAWPVALNPLYHLTLAMERAPDRATRDAAYAEALGLILGLFERLDPERWATSPGMQQYALMGSVLVLRTASTAPGQIPTIARVGQVLEDDALRAELLARYPDPDDAVVAFWTIRHPKASEGQKTSLQALLRRLDLLMQNPIVRPMLTIERPTLDLLDAMEQGRIVIIAFPHRRLSGLAPLIGMLLLATIVSAAYARPGDARSRRTVALIIDELQVFLAGYSRDLRDAITQLRAFGIAGIYAHQTLTQLGDLLDELLANSASRLILRTEEPDASVYARKYASFELTAADISAQPARQHAYAVAMQPATGAPVAFSIIPQPWPAPVPADDIVALRNPAWWEAALPPDPDPCGHQADVLLARQIYRPLAPARYAQVVGQLARMPDDLWALLHERWERIRAAQRAAALTRIGYVPNRLERQAMASRLETRACGLLADAAYQRQRWARDPQAPLVAPTRTASPPPRVAPARTALIPGLAPDDPVRPAFAPPAAGPSAEDLLRQRGRRRADADIAAGFAFGPSPHVPPPATPDAPTPTTDTEDS